MASRRGWTACSTVIAWLWLAASGASAQASTERSSGASGAERTAAEEARARFVDGTVAMDEARWADAVLAFEAAYELTASPVALYNLCFSLRALGRYRAASDGLVRLLEAPGLDDEMRADATLLLEEARSRLASLSLEGLPSETREIDLDAEPIAVGEARPWVIEVDPGSHSLLVRAEGYEPFDWRGELAAGERTEVVIDLTPLPIVTASEASVPLEAEPAFWIVLGLVVVGAGVGTGVGLWAADEAAQLRPEGTRLSL